MAVVMAPREERAIEFRVYDEETDRFVRRAYRDSRRTIRLIEGGLLVEAHRVAAGLHAEAFRRMVQRGLSDDPEGTAA